jgi:urease accessory protein
VLSESADKRYVVRIKATEVITIAVDSMERMGKLCYELGNRHLSIRVRSGSVSVPYDHPTFEYVQRLGFEPVVSQDDFSDFLIIKAHAGSGTVVGQHSHIHGDEHNHGQGHTHGHPGSHAHLHGDGYGHDHDVS